MIVDGLCDEIGHYFSDWSIVLSTFIQDVFDNFI